MEPCSRTTQEKGTPGDLQDSLFDDTVLRTMNTDKCKFAMKGIQYPRPGTSLFARPLRRSDYNKGFLQLLSQLTKVGDYSKEAFEAQFNSMQALSGMYYVVVIEDTSTATLVASATLLIEHKFIHGAVIRGRIEDVVVDSEYRSSSLGSFLLELLTCFSEEIGCYKITLDCKLKLVGFYEKFGYNNEGQCFLTKRFKD